MTDREKIEVLHHQIMELQAELRGLTRSEESVGKNYSFKTIEGDVTLSSLFRDRFGDRRDLVVIHNMGKRCAYCTAYADGLNGVLPHLESRSAVVLLSPDAPQEQQTFAAGRGWRFRMVSMEGTGSEFAKDMGFYGLDGGEEWPGFSVFHRSEAGRKMALEVGHPLSSTGLTEMSGHFEYLVAWTVYAIAGICCCIVWWKMTKGIGSRGLREILRGIAVVLVFTPWYAGDSPEFYAPAIVVLMMDLLLEGAKSGMKGGIALLFSTFFMLLFLTVRQLWGRRQNR
jgi:predicted dithiol-disulfide oxidoreductase (DUF899 family)